VGASTQRTALKKVASKEGRYPTRGWMKRRITVPADKENPKFFRDISH
jgi:hypothetical protein